MTSFFIVNESVRRHDYALAIVKELTRDLAGSFVSTGKVRGGWRIQGNNIPFSVVEEIMSRCEEI
jgi:hypothetical protein